MRPMAEYVAHFTRVAPVRYIATTNDVRGRLGRACNSTSVIRTITFNRLNTPILKESDIDQITITPMAQPVNVPAS